jgi:hypothetical protein
VTCLDCRAGVGQRGHNLSRGSGRVTLVLLTVQGLFVRAREIDSLPAEPLFEPSPVGVISHEAFRVAPSSEWRTLHTDLVRGFRLPR